MSPAPLAAMVAAASSSSLLGVLKYVLLAILWVFFILVLRAVLTEVRRPAAAADPTSARDQQPAAARLGGSVRSPRFNSTAGPDPVARPDPAPRATAGSSDQAARDEWAGRAQGRAPVTALRVVEPAKTRGRSFVLGDEMTLGRASECGVAMPDDSFVSSRHARVWRADGGTWVEDLGSTNGTLLNGTRLNGPTVLSPGDRLQVGKTILEAAR